MTTLWKWGAVLAGAAVLVWALVAARGGGPAGAAETGAVRKGPLHAVVAATGQVEPLRQVFVGAKAFGRLAEVSAAEGDWVQAGQILAVLDHAEIDAQVAEAEAALAAAEARARELENGARPEEKEEAAAMVERGRASVQVARLEYERTRKLRATDNATEAEIDSARSRLQVAEAELHSAEAHHRLIEAGARKEVCDAARAEVRRLGARLDVQQSLLENTRARAPFAGKILRKHREIGDLLMGDLVLPVFTLADISKVRVRAEIDETDIRKVRVGQAVAVTADAFPGRTFQGRVAELGSEMGPKRLRSDQAGEMIDTKVMDVKIDLADPGALPLGLRVNVSIVAVDRPDALLAPLKAVVRTLAGPKCRVRSGGNTEERIVELGADDGESVEILAGLAEGDVLEWTPRAR